MNINPMLPQAKAGLQRILSAVAEECCISLKAVNGTERGRAKFKLRQGINEDRARDNGIGCFPRNMCVL